MPSNYSRNTGKFIFLADILKNSVCDKVTGIEMYKAPDGYKAPGLCLAWLEYLKNISDDNDGPEDDRKREGMGRG